MCYSRARSLVGITGTNGKTSLATILSHVANNLGLPSIALGNIGYPLSSAAVNGETMEKIFFSKPVLFKLCHSTVLMAGFALMDELFSRPFGLSSK